MDTARFPPAYVFSSAEAHAGLKKVLKAHKALQPLQAAGLLSGTGQRTAVSSGPLESRKGSAIREEPAGSSRVDADGFRIPAKSTNNVRAVDCATPHADADGSRSSPARRSRQRTGGSAVAPAIAFRPNKASSDAAVQAVTTETMDVDENENVPKPAKTPKKRASDAVPSSVRRKSTRVSNAHSYVDLSESEGEVEDDDIVWNYAVDESDDNEETSPDATRETAELEPARDPLKDMNRTVAASPALRGRRPSFDSMYDATPRPDGKNGKQAKMLIPAQATTAHSEPRESQLEIVAKNSARAEDDVAVANVNQTAQSNSTERATSTTAPMRFDVWFSFEGAAGKVSRVVHLNDSMSLEDAFERITEKLARKLEGRKLLALLLRFDEDNLIEVDESDTWTSVLEMVRNTGKTRLDGTAELE